MQKIQILPRSSTCFVCCYFIAWFFLASLLVWIIIMLLEEWVVFIWLFLAFCYICVLYCKRVYYIFLWFYFCYSLSLSLCYYHTWSEKLALIKMRARSFAIKIKNILPTPTMVTMMTKNQQQSKTMMMRDGVKLKRWKRRKKKRRIFY